MCIRDRFTKLLEALEFMHNLGITHCDVKPDNVCIQIDDPSIIKLIDFGSCLCSESTTNSYMQNRWYRAPDVMLGMPQTDAKKMDVWSVACTVVHLHLGYPVFRGASVAAVLAAQQAVLGPYPVSFLQNSSPEIRPMHFTPDDALYQIVPAQLPHEGPLVQKLTPTSTPLAQLLSGADPLMLDLLTSMLNYEPGVRPGMTEALAHPFIANHRRGEESNESTMNAS